VSDDVDCPTVRAASGRVLADLSVEAVLAGELTPQDIRIHADTLRRQARVALEHGNPQLAENLLRAAELTLVSDAELMRVYEALRPGRSTRDELAAIAERLEEAGARRCSVLVREALEVYTRRGLVE
jgi:propanediol dehydratase small subunit